MSKYADRMQVAVKLDWEAGLEYAANEMCPKDMPDDELGTALRALKVAAKKLNELLPDPADYVEGPYADF